jgi:putative SOS response-associated peptidase YedK
MATMCGRYAASRRPEDLVEEFEVERVEVRQPLPPDWNVAPTKQVYAVLTRAHGGQDEPRRTLRVLRWGLVPSWAKDPSIGSRMINARLETAAEKPAFRRAFSRRRCLVPADGYYEWYTPAQPGGGSGARPRKQPFFIHRADGRPLALAGIYEFWHEPGADPQDPAAWTTTMALLTTSAPDDTGRIHDRAPLLLEPASFEAWLDPARTDPAQVLELLVPAAPGLLEAYPVSTAVNNVRSNGPHLLDPLPPEPPVA